QQQRDGAVKAAEQAGTVGPDAGGGRQGQKYPPQACAGGDDIGDGPQPRRGELVQQAESEMKLEGDEQRQHYRHHPEQEGKTGAVVLPDQPGSARQRQGEQIVLDAKADGKEQGRKNKLFAQQKQQRGQLEGVTQQLGIIDAGIVAGDQHHGGEEQAPESC